MSHDTTKGQLIERLGVSALRAIATRALAGGDDYSRGLLREQLESEERTNDDSGDSASS